MGSKRWQDDDELLTELAEAARRAGRVPEAVRRAGRAAFAVRMLEPGRVLASISYDSILDRLQVRKAASDGRRFITFEADSVSVEIEVTADQMVGQLIPPVPGQVEVLTVDGVSAETTASSLGWFVLPRPAAGPVRLRCVLSEEVVVTDWVRL